MVKISVTSVLLVEALLHLVQYCNALVHIHLSLDGSTHQRFGKIKNKIQHNVNDFSDSNLASIKQKVGGGHIRLYISGDFTQTPEKDEFFKFTDLVWGKGKKNAKDLAKIVSQMFGKDAIVIVVFPELTQLLCGIEFFESFEENIQKTHKDISIGREKIHFYFFLDEKSKHLPGSFTLHKDEDKLISIAANRHFDFYNFGSKTWSNGVESVSQVLIHEADTVEIRLEAKCAEDKNELTVGGLKPQSLAVELLKVVKAEGQTHPYQTIRIRLPKDCSKDVQKRSKFTENLISILRGKGLDVHGVEPSAVIQLASSEPKMDDFPGHAWKKIEADTKENSDIRQYHAEFDNNKMIVKNIRKVVIQNIDTELSDIKQLSIQVHCHGKFERSSNSVCELNEKELAGKLHSIVPTKISNIQFIFYACNVGTQKGQKYALTLLQNLHNINTHEVISFQSWIAQEGSVPAITVAIQDKYRATTIIDKKKIAKEAEPLLFNLNDAQIGRLGGRAENHAFGRFTSKIKKINNMYKSFPVLPKTELELN